MEEDTDLSLIKRRKLLELRRRMLVKEKLQEKMKKYLENKKILEQYLVGRAVEVLNAAEQQYPQATRQIVAVLARLALNGEITGKISGENLLWLFRSLGIDVKLKTKILIQKSGEMVSLEKKLRGKI